MSAGGTRVATIAVALCALCALGAARGVAAQGTGNVAIVGPPGDTLRSVTPTFSVIVSNFAGSRPLRVTLEADTNPRFSDTPVSETTIEIADTNTTFTITPRAALPEDARLYFRAVVRDPSGFVGTSLPIGPRVVPKWVVHVTPPAIVGQPVRTRTPRFVWRSPSVGEPPGPWQYTIRITNLGQDVIAANVGSDTTYVPPFDLETNAVHSWSIEARLAGSAQSTILGPINFLVEDPATPVAATDVYPPFPNPFPSLINDATCIWFDLKNESSVNLDVHDLRGLRVRRLLPNAELAGALPAGRYGRGRTEFNEGCDRRIEWDGTDDRGNPVPEGVYVIRFRADGIVRTKKVLFRGRP